MSEPRAVKASEMELEADGVHLPGTLAVPPNPIGVVVFAHGSGSSRLSPRNQLVAERLQADGFATLLFDLLTEAEAADRGNVFDIVLLAERLTSATSWIQAQPQTKDLPIGLFGASTGAAAALVAAADAATSVEAVVSRGGRPDLAEASLAWVTAPTLLLVGELDSVVLELNQEAASQLRGPHRLLVVPGAGHLFEEPGALEEVARAASDWFSKYLTR